MSLKDYCDTHYNTAESTDVAHTLMKLGSDVGWTQEDYDLAISHVDEIVKMAAERDIDAAGVILLMKVAAAIKLKGGGKSTSILGEIENWIVKKVGAGKVGGQADIAAGTRVYNRKVLGKGTKKVWKI